VDRVENEVCEVEEDLDLHVVVLHVLEFVWVAAERGSQDVEGAHREFLAAAGLEVVQVKPVFLHVRDAVARDVGLVRLLQALPVVQDDHIAILLFELLQDVLLLKEFGHEAVGGLVLAFEEQHLQHEEEVLHGHQVGHRPVFHPQVLLHAVGSDGVVAEGGHDGLLHLEPLEQDPLRQVLEEGADRHEEDHVVDQTGLVVAEQPVDRLVETLLLLEGLVVPGVVDEDPEELQGGDPDGGLVGGVDDGVVFGLDRVRG